MITNPEKIKFENKNDVIDYVTKGLPPTKKQFTAVMAKVHDPGNGEGIIIVNEGMFIDCDQATFEEAMHRVYENRIRNRNICIGASAGIILGLLFAGAHRSKKEKDED